MSTLRKTQIFMNMAHGTFYVIAIVCIAVLTNRLSDATTASTSSLKKITTDVDSLKTTTSAMNGTLNQTTATLGAVTNVVNNLQPVISNLDVATFRLNGAMLNLQRPCNVTNDLKSTFYTDLYSRDSVMPCGMFADTAQTLSTVRGAFGQFEIAAAHENKNLTNLDKQEKTLFDNVNGLVVAYTRTGTDINGYLEDKATHRVLNNFANMSDSGVGILADGKTSADYITKELVTPKTFKQKLFGGLGDTYDIIAYYARHAK